MKVRILAPEGRGKAAVFVRCPRHLEDLLAAELVAFGLGAGTEHVGGIELAVDLRQAAMICLRSRIASRVLWPLAAFTALDADALYEGVSRLRWDAIVRGDATLAVGFDGTSAALRHTGFSARRVKDAVVDALRTARGARPDVDVEDPDLRLQAVMHRERVTLYLDLAGRALHRRGWRGDAGDAPLKENLAAALLRRGGWHEGETGWLVDPLCGSGTLLVEGALIAANVAPGVLRERFGFDAFAAAPAELRAELEAELPAPVGPVRLFGRDADAAQIERARAHLVAAGAGTRFDAQIDLAVDRVEDLVEPPTPVALVASNPPYGARMAEGGALVALGRSLRRRAAGVPVSILVGAAAEGPGADPVPKLDLPGLTRHPCRNGPLDAWMLTGTVEQAQGSLGEGDIDAASLEHAVMFANRVRKNAQRLGKLAKRLGTDAYRLYDRDLPEYGLVVDRYGDALCVQEFRPPATVDAVMASRRRSAAMAVLAEAAGVEPEAVYFRERRRQRPEGQYGVLDRRGEQRMVEEAGARFRVNLSDYLDTGLYLDSRGVRREIRASFRKRGGGRFLNLYCYTATATVQAALGGASESLSVDLSKTYLEWAAQHLADNGLIATRHRRVRSDVRAWIVGAAADEGLFDVILVDPPTFSNSASMEDDLDLQRDHVAMIDGVLPLLAPGGELLLVVHARKFRMGWQPGEGFECTEITRLTLDEDCGRGHPAHRCWRIVREA